MKRYLLCFLLLLVLISFQSGVIASEDEEKQGWKTELAIGGNDIASNENLILVNKLNSLDGTYVPGDLVYPDIAFVETRDTSRRMMRKEAARSAEDLFSKAREAGIKLIGVSAYRSFWRQHEIYFNNVSRVGRKEADRFSARPGHSEHQTGLAIDVSGPEVDYVLNQDFGMTEAGSWVRENAADFGFIIRYPPGKEDVTGFQYEPWHLRYVGEEHAREISRNNLTLEEYVAYILVE